NEDEIEIKAQIENCDKKNSSLKIKKKKGEENKTDLYKCFSKSGKNFELENDTILTCQLESSEGYVSAKLDLDTIFFNQNGRLRRGFGGFKQNSKNIKLEKVGDNEDLHLTADCERKDKTFRTNSWVNLDGYFGNKNGKIVYNKAINKKKFGKKVTKSD
ncbi:hypothetical protein HK099_008634, partial [Clydaea vesicula]